MLRWAVLAWIVGLLTVVPYATYYLFVRAPRDQYALLITLVLFWIFGFWGVVGPILTAVKVRSVFRTLERSHAEGTLLQALRGAETRDVAVTMIASENRIPRFVAAKVYRLLVQRLSMAAASSGPSAADEADGKRP